MDSDRTRQRESRKPIGEVALAYFMNPALFLSAILASKFMGWQNSVVGKFS